MASGATAPEPAYGGCADVVVVGAGPGGAACALQLARAGFDVVLADRAPGPRPKACGECLSPRATRLLQQLDVLDAVLAAGAASLGGWRIVAPSGHSFAEHFASIAGSDPLASTGLAIDRATLDALLAAAAVRAGATLLAPFRVEGLLWQDGRVSGVHGRDAAGVGRAIRARVVVGADGLRSVVARQIGALRTRRWLRRRPASSKVSLTLHMSGVAAVDDLGEMHLAARACLGIAPLRREPRALCNVTIVVDAADSAAAAPETRWRKALERFPAVAERLHDAVPVGPRAGPRPWLGSGAFVQPTRRAAVPGCLLVGDAAGYFDPFTGQGICHALTDALAAAAAIEKLLCGRSGGADSLDDYATRQRRRTREAYALQRAIDVIVRPAGPADCAVALLSRSASLRRALLAATGDLITPRALLSPTLALTFLAETMRRRSA
jgi:menaquinone-9 beta-reductase